MVMDLIEQDGNADFLSGWQMAVAIKGKSLFDAIQRGDEKMVQRLIEEGVPTSNINLKGQTAAHIAAKVGNLVILKYLLSINNDFLLKVKDKTGRNILHTSVENGSIDIVRYLIEDCKLDVFHVSNLFQGNSAVHLAAIKGHTEILKYFIEEMHVDVDEVNKEGEPLVFLASGNSHFSTMKYLIEQCHADMTMTDYKNRNILFPAVMSRNMTVLEYISNNKNINLDINWKDKEGRTILHWSALNNYLKISKYIVDIKHAQVDVADQMGKTPLHLAVEAGHIKLVELLYYAGADPTTLDVNNKTAIQLAKDEKMIQFLTDYPRVRVHRSVSRLLVPARRFSISVTGPRSVHKIATGFFGGRGFINGQTHEEHVSSYRAFNSLLTLANVIASIPNVSHMNLNQ